MNAAQLSTPAPTGQPLFGPTSPARRWRLTYTGMAMLATLVGLFLLATNYQNNLVYLMVLLIASTLLLSVRASLTHLRDLRVSIAPPAPVFCGSTLMISVTTDTSRPCHGLRLVMADADLLLTNQTPAGRHTHHLLFQCPRRGHRPIAEARVYSFYPFGLIEISQSLTLDLHCWVYPAPQGRHLTSPIRDIAYQTSDEPDFYGHACYQPGARLSQIDWRASARADQLMIKQWRSPATDTIISLNWHDTDGDTEQRLSSLAAQLLHAERSGKRYSLTLPGVVYPPGNGTRHLEHCLQKLAEFPTEAGA